jgi:DNA polymerase-3 subunit beta
MNFVTSSITLLHHLQSISGALSSNTKLPILDNFLFKVNQNKLTIVATDLETTMVTHLEIQSESDGEIAIPAKLLLEVLKNLPDQPCAFRINKDNMLLKLATIMGNQKW